MTRILGLAGRWRQVWLGAIPPHSFALLRILFGALGLIRLAALTPLELYWAADGIVPLPGGGTGIRAWVLDHGLGTVAGWGLYAYMAVAFASMLVGFRSNASVLAAYLGLVLETWWNTLPLSAAHLAMTDAMFCLVWADTGRVLSVDAQRRGPDLNLVPCWPLLLLQCQVAVIYFTTGLWKILSPAWRDGSAVHWAVNVNTFHRFPWPLPPSVEPLLTFATWFTLLFELGFPLMVFFGRTRRLALWLGLGLHLGMAVTLELGMFSWVMLATYVAFLAPSRTPALADRILAMGLRSRRTASRPSSPISGAPT